MPELLSGVCENLINDAEVGRITGIGRTARAERRNPKSKYYDPAFPKAVTIGGANSVRYVESEVRAWVRAKIEASRKGVES